MVSSSWYLEAPKKRIKKQTHMKTTKILSLIMLVLLAAGCKNDNWLDWKVQNELWLIQNGQKTDVITTPTGLQYKCIEKGWDKGTRPDDAKIVVIDYEGKLINGYVFGSAKEYPNNVSAFVAGFAEGLKKMNLFGEYEFYIPYNLGYGEEGTGTEGSSLFIPPYSTLIFRVYLHSAY